MEPTTPPPAEMPPASSPASSPPATSTEDKTVAIVAYITIFGFIAAIIINSNKKTQLGAFHLRQALGLFLTMIALGVCQFPLLIIPILGWLCALALWGCWFVFLIMGLVGAVKGEMNPVPVLGPMYQKWFGNAFN